MKTSKTDKIFELSAPYDNTYQGSSPRALFVCSAGMLRSATAATIGSKFFSLNTRNCGSEDYALIPLSLNLILWAQKIFFVNRDNYETALENFKWHDLDKNLESKSVVWNIEDKYDYMDPKLQDSIIEELMYHYEYVATR